MPADVFVYRDTAGQPDATGPGPNDPAYWYDLPGAGPAEETPPAAAKTRGPFEPLVSSADPPGTVRHAAAEPQAAGPAAAGPTPSVPGEDERDDAAYAQARKLEQIRDLYLTAEAIGEANVDKHFDHLLAQQRELISEYFRQSATVPANDAAGQPPADPEVPRPPSQPGPRSENARVAADQPRAW